MSFGPEYYKQFSDADIRLRCVNRAKRLWQLFALQAPLSVIDDAQQLFDGAFQEWKRREQERINGPA